MKHKMLVYESQDDLDVEFNASVEIIKTLTERPTNDELLKLYALYKQATKGNNGTDGPPVINVKERAKWNAWYCLRGVSRHNAKKDYSQFVKELIEKYPHS